MNVKDELRKLVFFFITNTKNQKHGGFIMNKVILMGRLTSDPEVRYSQGESSTAIAKFSLAVDRKIKREGEVSTYNNIYYTIFVGNIFTPCSI